MGDDEPETTEYRFQPPKPLWTDWGDTVPRSITLQERLETLIAADCAGLIDVPHGEDPEEYLGDDARRAVIQIRRHAMRASQDLGTDEDSCREEIRAVKRICEDVI